MSFLFVLFLAHCVLQSYINTRYSLGVSSGRDEPVLEKQKLPINFSPAPKKNFKDNNKNIHIPRKNLMLMIIKYFFSSVFLLRHRDIQIKKLPRLARVKLGDDIIIPIIKHIHTLVPNNKLLAVWNIYNISLRRLRINAPSF